mgnify:FL=1
MIEPPLPGEGGRDYPSETERFIPRDSERRPDMGQDVKTPHHRQCKLEDRLIVQNGLDEAYSLSAIAKKIGKHRSTVSLEVRRNSVAEQKGAFGRPFNDCLHRRACDRRQLCEDNPDCLSKCSTCRLCNKVCPDYEKERCSRLAAPPYVCNGCPNRRRCTLEKRVYDARQADKIARELLVTSRQGICVSPEELKEIDGLLRPCIERGQSINHIYESEPGRFNICQDTLRKYIALNLLSCRNGDLPKKMRMRPRHAKRAPRRVESACLKGRTYADYLAYRDAHHHLPIAQTDTVIGHVGGKAILTLLLLDCDLLIPILLDHKNAACVTAAYQDLAQRLHAHGIAPSAHLAITLTDRGTEFSAPTPIEALGTPDNPIRVFYCDPQCSYQKGALERAHVDLRRILPGGTSFDHLTQSDLDLVASHLNSYIHPDLGNRTPIAIARERHGQALLDALNLTEIHPRDVILTPALLFPRHP